jgi:hypothetical protein
MPPFSKGRYVYTNSGTVLMKKSMLSRCVVLFACAFLTALWAQTTPNYVETTVFQEENDNSTALVATEYSDGLGRAIQSRKRINLNANYSALLSGTLFDNIGRPYRTIKAFPSTVSGYTDNIQTLANTNYGSSYCYYETVFSDDPLARALETGAPGSDFAAGNGHTQRFWYFGTGIVAGGNDNVDRYGFIKAERLSEWTTTADRIVYLSNLPTNLVDVPDLYLTVVIDQNDNIGQELKDIFGKTIKKWACTGNFTNTIIDTFLYDIAGNLLMETPALGATQQLLPILYVYNSIGQLLSKTVPDIAGSSTTENYEYDDAGRMKKVSRVLDGTTYESIDIAYDDFGRVLKKNKNGGGGTQIYYYYDGLKDIPKQVLQNCIKDSRQRQGMLVDFATDDNAKGRLTAAVAVNEIPHNGFTDKYYVADFYKYDDDGRVCIHYKAIPSLALQKLSYGFDFMGRLVQDTIRTNDSKRIRFYTYDFNGRLRGVFSDALQPDHVLVYYDYDETGKLKQKHFCQSGVVNSEYVLNFDYDKFNDWLETISSAPPDQYNSFLESIFYYKPSGGSSLYNGNISEADYKYGTKNPLSLIYSYDAINRLIHTNASSDQSGGNPLPFATGDYTEHFAYDNVGRISTKWLQKYSTQQNATQQDATRNYTYYPASSRLKRVSHQSQTTNYLYDNYGNMVYDGSKKMVVTYDWRNLPVNFTFYSALLQNVDSYTNGIVTPAQLALLQGNMTPVSDVLMLYDADGNRVLKIKNDM